MEGLQGFLLGALVASVLWTIVSVTLIAKAYSDGHIDGQQSQIDKLKE